MWRLVLREESWLKIEQLTKDYAKAEANRAYLTEFRKSKKAMLMADAEAKEPGLAIAKQEREAYSNPEYQQLLEGIKEAVEQATALRFQIEVFKMRFETWRSKQATSRAEMSLR
jgi:hypothetical protein